MIDTLRGLIDLLVRRGRTAVRPAGRHRRVATRRLLTTDTQVTTVVNYHIWRGVVERPKTSTDRNSGVFPVRFSFGVGLRCAEDVAVVIDPALVGAR